MTVAIVCPARLNSERLPNKQILPIGKSNMFEIACRKLQILSAEYEVAVLIYPGDKTLMDIAKRFKHIKIIERSEESVNVDGPSNLIFEGFKEVEADSILIMNPCFIFTTPKTYRRAIYTFEDSGASSATSVKPFKSWLYNNKGQMLVMPNMSNLSTKDINGYYEPAHMFHICNKENMLKYGRVLDDNHAMILVPWTETIDIDNVEDYEFAKWKYEK